MQIKATAAVDNFLVGVATRLAWEDIHDDELGDYFAARGNKGHFILVFPKDRIAILRQGIDVGDIDRVATITAIAKRVGGP